MSRFIDCEGGNIVTAEDLTERKSDAVPNECKKERRECGWPFGESGVDLENFRRQKPTSEKRESGVRLASKRMFKIQVPW